MNPFGRCPDYVCLVNCSNTLMRNTTKGVRDRLNLVKRDHSNHTKKTTRLRDEKVPVESWEDAIDPDWIPIPHPKAHPATVSIPPPLLVVLGLGVMDKI